MPPPIQFAEKVGEADDALAGTGPRRVIPPHGLPETVIKQLNSLVGSQSHPLIVYEFNDALAMGRKKVVALTDKSIWLCVLQEVRADGLNLMSLVSKTEVLLLSITEAVQKRKNTLFSGPQSEIIINWGRVLGGCALESGIDQGDYFYGKLKERMANAHS